MKPHVARAVPATQQAIEKAFGQKIGSRFVPNPSVLEYAVVLNFSGTNVVASGELRRALKKFSVPGGPMLVIARDLTIEARQAAIDAGCDIMASHEFGWTDASYHHIRQL